MQTERTDFWSQLGRERVGRLERVVLKHITIYEIDSQFKLLYDARKLNPIFCDNLEGWDGEEGGREI